MVVALLVFFGFVFYKVMILVMEQILIINAVFKNTMIFTYCLNMSIMTTNSQKKSHLIYLVFLKVEESVSLF